MPVSNHILSYEQLFIGGRWQEPSSDGEIEVISPHTEQPIARVPAAAEADVDAAVAAARQAFDASDWPRMPVADRLEIVGRFAAEYEKHLDEFAAMTTEENGVPITQTRAIASMVSSILATNTAIARDFPWTEQRRGTTGCEVTVRREPVGVVAAIVPWNAPQFLTMAKLAPALVAGCTVVIKPAPETPVDGLFLGEIALAAGLPAGVLAVLPAGREVSEYLVSHSGVDKVAFTGSTAAGRRIASICGQQLKHVNLELGGKSASIVLDDADIGAVAASLLQSGLILNGQECTSKNRFIVTRACYRDTVDALADVVRNCKVGDPMDTATQIGPLVSVRQRDRVEGYIKSALDQGAQLIVGGLGAPDGCDQGWYVRPTLFAEVDNSMKIAQEEIFGPVISVIPVENETAAIAAANDSPYGLSGAVWTADPEHGYRVAAQVRTGTIGVNRAMTLDFRVPFGGVKASGMGREFGPEGLGEYLEYQTIFTGSESVRVYADSVQPRGLIRGKDKAR